MKLYIVIFTLSVAFLSLVTGFLFLIFGSIRSSEIFSRIFEEIKAKDQTAAKFTLTRILKKNLFFPDDTLKKLDGLYKFSKHDKEIIGGMLVEYSRIQKKTFLGFFTSALLFIPVPSIVLVLLSYSSD